MTSRALVVALEQLEQLEQPEQVVPPVEVAAAMRQLLHSMSHESRRWLGRRQEWVLELVCCLWVGLAFVPPLVVLAPPWACRGCRRACPCQIGCAFATRCGRGDPCGHCGSGSACVCESDFAWTADPCACCQMGFSCFFAYRCRCGFGGAFDCRYGSAFCRLAFSHYPPSSYHPSNLSLPRPPSFSHLFSCPQQRGPAQLVQALLALVRVGVLLLAVASAGAQVPVLVPLLALVLVLGRPEQQLALRVLLGLERQAPSPPQRLRPPRSRRRPPFSDLTLRS